MFHPRKIVNVLSLILIVIFLAISIIVVQQTIFTRQEADEKNLLTFTASSPSALADKEFSIDINVKKPATPVTGVYFSIAYPETKINLILVDTWDSAFDMPGEDILGNGYLKYGRDSSKPLVGDLHVVTLKFEAKEPVDLSEFVITGDASIVTPDLKNILSQRPVVTYVDRKKSRSESFFDWINLIITDYPHLVMK